MILRQSADLATVPISRPSHFVFRIGSAGVRRYQPIPGLIPLDIGMRSVIGPLLFGILPLLAAGCVLPERSLGRAEDLGFRPRGMTTPRVSSESPSGDSVAFKALLKNRRVDQNDAATPETDRQIDREANNLVSQTSDADRSQLTPGHSSDSVRSLDNVAWPSTTGSRSATTSNFDKASAAKANLNAVSERVSMATTDSAPFNIRQAGNRSDGNATDSPIQQQNLEIERTNPDPKASQSRRQDTTEVRAEVSKTGSRSAKATDVPMWSDRPADRNATQPASVASLNTKTSAPVRQTSQTNSTLDRSKLSSTRTLPMLPWQTELEQLIVRAEQDLAQTKPEGRGDLQSEALRKHAHLRLLYLMAQRQEDAMTAIPNVDSFQQEYWQQMVWAMSNSFDTIQFPESSERAAQSVPPLSAALRQMREQAALSIKNMTFCRKISYFGNYERFPRNDFTAGHEVLLYTEIENFISAPTADGEYRTSLKSLIEIADSQGKIVWTKGFPSTEDFCRNPRRDYFHNYQFYIPEDLSTGAYTLKLTIVDELSKKRASNSLNFVLK